MEIAIECSPLTGQKAEIAITRGEARVEWVDGTGVTQKERGFTIKKEVTSVGWGVTTVKRGSKVMCIG
jgi:hypothetical protein